MNFPITHWSLLAQASWNGDAPSRKAVETLCGLYWGPVHQFILTRGIADPEAQDLTQDFMVHVLQHSLFTRADPLRGRFRSFLLGALVRFLGDVADRRAAVKRGGNLRHVSLDAEDFVASGPVSCPPEAVRVFDREWALTVLESALDGVRREYAAQRREHIFTTLQRFLPGSEDPPRYESAVQELGVTLPGLKTELHRLRGRVRALMRDEVTKTVSAPHEIDAEMTYLHQVLADCPVPEAMKVRSSKS